MKKQVKIILIFYLLLAVISLTGVFFTEKEEDLEEQVFLALLAQGAGGEEEECIKARAILLRSNLVAAKDKVELATPKQLELWLEEDITGERYRKIKKSIDETRGMILIYENQAVYLPYHSISCGITREAGEITKETYAYIKSASCKEDILAENYIEVRKYSKKEFPGEVKVISRYESGYVDKVSIGEIVYTGEEFRKMYNLASACFFVDDVENGIRILTKGQGHGLGMSLNMANELAKKGSSATDILNYFFLGLQPALYEEGEVCPY